MASTLEALERYPVPHSTAKLMPSATSQERVCDPNKQGVSTQAPRRKAEGEERVANRKIALRPSLSALRMWYRSKAHCTKSPAKVH